MKLNIIQNFRCQFRGREIKLVLAINTGIGLFLYLLTFIKFQRFNGFELFSYLFLSQAIGISIYLLIVITAVSDLAPSLKKGLFLTLIFAAGGCIGTVLWYASVRIFSFFPALEISLSFMLFLNVLLALIFGTLVNGYFVFRERLAQAVSHLAEKEIEKQRLMELKTRAELEALRAKINPHFLFNTLNSIASLIPVDPERAELMVQKLAALFRYTLEASSREYVTLSQELVVVRDYLNIEKIRLGDRLQFSIYCDPEMEDLPIPGLLLQPLVENSVKHGISTSMNGGVIKIDCFKESNHYILRVFNTGKTDPFPTDEQGFGLRAVGERLKKMYGDKYDFHIRFGKGTEVVVMWPAGQTENSDSGMRSQR